ncbi:MAG: diadenylate cyclase [Planctomycetota bacterium]|nr:diadenylate cyclase [Planctomycetota bacterium]
MSTVIPSHWGHQEKFRAEAERLARGIFEELDPTLEPRVLLIGLVADHDRDLYPLFVESADKEGMPKLFLKASKHAKEVRAALYAEAEREGGLDEAGFQKRRIVLEAWRQGVERALAEGEEEHDVVSYCSEPRAVDKFQICTVLQLKRSSMKPYYRLARDDKDIREQRPRSLLEATVYQYMRKCAVGLAEHSAGVTDPGGEWDHEEILRGAGRLFADFPALGGLQDVTRRGLFHACNTISSLRYEGDAATGELIISKPDHPGVAPAVTLENPIRLYNYTAVRKLLEAAREGYSLLSDGTVVYGLGSLSLASSLPGQSLFRVGFLKHYTWELSYGMRTMMRVSYGHPRMPKLPLLEARFRQILAATFPELENDASERLWEMAHAACEQEHGTILVIHPEAESEARRLEAQGAPIAAAPLDTEGVLSLTSVDGAMLMDPAAQCHAFGVILDGLTSTHANSARGARYNSALRYVYSSRVPCLAVVVSEDGGVEVVANS